MKTLCKHISASCIAVVAATTLAASAFAYASPSRQQADGGATSAIPLVDNKTKAVAVVDVEHEEIAVIPQEAVSFIAADVVEEKLEPEAVEVFKEAYEVAKEEEEYTVVDFFWFQVEPEYKETLAPEQGVAMTVSVPGYQNGDEVVVKVNGIRIPAKNVVVESDGKVTLYLYDTDCAVCIMKRPEGSSRRGIPMIEVVDKDRITIDLIPINKARFVPYTGEEKLPDLEDCYTYENETDEDEIRFPLDYFWFDKDAEYRQSLSAEEGVILYSVYDGIHNAFEEEEYNQFSEAYEAVKAETGYNIADVFWFDLVPEIKKQIAEDQGVKLPFAVPNYKEGAEYTATVNGKFVPEECVVDNHDGTVTIYVYEIGSSVAVLYK